MPANARVDSTAGAGWHTRALYSYDQTMSDDVACLPASHLATVNFAPNFRGGLS